MISIADTITIGRVSTYLATNYNSNQILFGGALAAPTSPVTIGMVTDALEWGNAAGQDANNIQGLANYLIWLCGKFNLQAQYIMGGVGGGTVLPPSGGGGSTGSGLLRLVITNANLSGNAFNDPRIVGKNIHIFISGYNEEWLYSPANFTQNATGIIITAPGFDPSLTNYEIIIQEYIPVSGSITTLATPTNFSRTFIGNNVKYDWDNVPNATAYVWQLASDFSFTTIIASGTSAISEVTINVTAPAPPLYFRVYATAIGYAQSAYGSIFFTPSALTTPVISFSTITTTGFRVLWSADANSNAFFIDIATDSGFATIVQSSNGSNVGHFDFSGGSTGIIYYVRVMQTRDPAWYNPSAYGLGNQTTS